MRQLWMIAMIAAGCLAQDGPTFEAVSIKPANIEAGGGFSMWLRGGPVFNDPARIDYHNVSLSDLIGKAYGVELYQTVGPDWLGTERYLIAGTLLPESTREQFQAMLRNLLADRFKVQLHRDRKEMGALLADRGQRRSEIQTPRRNAAGGKTAAVRLQDR